MTAVEDLDEALAFLDPHIEGRYVFACVDSVAPDLEPFAVIKESEGLTIIVDAASAAQYGLPTDEPFARITARAQTSLHSVGITATVTSTIASRGIPCNVVAGFHHDHFFVPADKGEETLAMLQALATQAKGWMPRD